MNKKLESILEKANKNYANVAERASKIISKQSPPTATEMLLGTLIQVEVINGCILTEILSLLNTPKDGDAE